MDHFSGGSPEQEMLDAIDAVREKFNITPAHLLKILAEITLYFITYINFYNEEYK